MAKRKDSRKAAKNRKAAKEKERLPINGDTLRRAVAWIVDAGIFSQLKFHGNTSWKAVDLVVLAVVWVWSGNATLTGAFTEAHGWSTEVLGRAAVGTYQGLLKALATSTKVLLPILKKRLHELMRTQARKHWRIGLWVAFAVDGSRVSVPRSKENEKAFCAPNYGKSSTAKYRRKKNKKKKNKKRMSKKREPVKPQIWVTLLWHMGMQMPWSWMTGPSNSSERDHLRQLNESARRALDACRALLNRRFRRSITAR